MAELIPCFRVDKPKKKITGDKPDDILVPEWCDWKLPWVGNQIVLILVCAPFHNEKAKFVL